MLAHLGYYVERSSGSHHQYKHRIEPHKDLVTVPKNLDEIFGDLLKSIINQIGCSKKEFYKILSRL
ncbi:MAG: type II toxin-antitoxin system HicA family toxin [candidate division Zixibacteria bacterium]|nr:type II toxin-antitoxin system HicA family toxin [candidate division Zixibacteria bacterium]